ncbi:hypothetical protein CQA53_07770 [Helicobacter didelphidarum]|uniref:Disulfide isomerase DsbG N-terminal domain-containing protein n=1 Tax=Helicobacter didelphidarum TaxID=2040648 RepID=A0A3D8IGL1_9HELI|nr:hypothetical protein CQA53_07770 [Helicobacter didelphidarum]
MQKLLKEQTNTDFKVVSNATDSLKDASFVIVESPNGERLALISNKEGTYIVPLNIGVGNATNSPLKIALDNVNRYNHDMKEKSVLAVFKKYPDSILKIPAMTSTKNTTYMVLDTTCPYCVNEIHQLDTYLKRGNIEILIVGILGEKASKRAAGFYAELPNAKTREQKIALLKKIFTRDYMPQNGNEEKAKLMSDSAFMAGVQGVPYMILK